MFTRMRDCLDACVIALRHVADYVPRGRERTTIGAWGKSTMPSCALSKVLYAYAHKYTQTTRYTDKFVHIHNDR